MVWCCKRCTTQGQAQVNVRLTAQSCKGAHFLFLTTIRLLSTIPPLPPPPPITPLPSTNPSDTMTPSPPFIQYQTHYPIA